jgi:hypothetical protein
LPVPLAPHTIKLNCIPFFTFFFRRILCSRYRQLAGFSYQRESHDRLDQIGRGQLNRTEFIGKDMVNGKVGKCTRSVVKEDDVLSKMVFGQNGMDAVVTVMVVAAGQMLQVPSKKGLGVKARFVAIRGKIPPFRATNHKLTCLIPNIPYRFEARLTTPILRHTRKALRPCRITRFRVCFKARVVNRALPLLALLPSRIQVDQGQVHGHAEALRKKILIAFGRLSRWLLPDFNNAACIESYPPAGFGRLPTTSSTVFTSSSSTTLSPSPPGLRL